VSWGGENTPVKTSRRFKRIEHTVNGMIARKRRREKEHRMKGMWRRGARERG
jgi:hypothetical protein